MVRAVSLTPTDMLKIQSAIDAYEKRFPNRRSPTAAEALAWQANKRGHKVATPPSEAGASSGSPLVRFLRNGWKRILLPKRAALLSLKQ